MYALVEIAGKQFKVEENSQLKIPYNNNKVGDKISFDKVLYFDDGTKKSIGNPYVSGLSIDAKVIEHGKSPKIIVFKLKRRKGYQKKSGHKQLYTVVEVGKLIAKKTTVKKAETEKTTAKKVAPKKTTAKKAAPKKTTAKKAAPKKTTAKKDK